MPWTSRIAGSSSARRTLLPDSAVALPPLSASDRETLDLKSNRAATRRGLFGQCLARMIRSFVGGRVGGTALSRRREGPGWGPSRFGRESRLDRKKGTDLGDCQLEIALGVPKIGRSRAFVGALGGRSTRVSRSRWNESCAGNVWVRRNWVKSLTWRAPRAAYEPSSWANPRTRRRPKAPPCRSRRLRRPQP